MSTSFNVIPLKTSFSNSSSKLGKKIQNLRKALDITQEKLAEHVNISRVHIGHIEQGIKKPSLDILQKISKALGVKVNELIPF